MSQIKVSGLDPYIARLVKTLNAIGIVTCFSCDGNYGRIPIFQKKQLPTFNFKAFTTACGFAILLDRYIIPKLI